MADAIVCKPRRGNSGSRQSNGPPRAERVLRRAAASRSRAYVVAREVRCRVRLLVTPTVPAAGRRRSRTGQNGPASRPVTRRPRPRGQLWQIGQALGAGGASRGPECAASAGSPPPIAYVDGQSATTDGGGGRRGAERRRPRSADSRVRCCTASRYPAGLAQRRPRTPIDRPGTSVRPITTARRRAGSGDGAACRRPRFS